MANFRIPLNYKEHVSRAVHNLSTTRRTTCHAMTAIPLYFRKMMNGDTFYFQTPQLLLQSQPTFAPVMGTYRLRIEWYFDSDANRYGWIDNNDRQTTEEVVNNRRHSFNFDYPDEENDFSITVFQDDTLRNIMNRNKNAFFNHGCITDYMGIAPGTMRNTFSKPFALDYILAYLNVMRTYHINTQFPNMPYIDNRFDSFNPNNQPYGWTFGYYSLKDLDNLFKMLRYFDNGHDFSLDFGQTDLPQKYRACYMQFKRYLKCCSQPHGGLFCTQYEPDLYRNLLNSDLQTLKAEISTNSDGSFTIEEFRFKNRLQMIYDRIASVGGRRSDVVRARWGITSNKGRDIPELLCVRSEYIDTSAITSNNASGNAGKDNDIVPGDLSGNVNQRKFPKGTQKFTATESGVLMAIVTITPLVDYCQNVERELFEVRFEDSFTPQMAQRGFEDVPFSDYSTIAKLEYDNEDPTAYPQDDVNNVVGKQIAWLREMTATNRVFGEFATAGFFETWVLKRNYTALSYVESEVYDDEIGGDRVVHYPITSTNISPYGNPLEWQYPFVAQTIDDPNFYLQVAFDIKAVRPVGRRYMPTLG